MDFAQYIYEIKELAQIRGVKFNQPIGNKEARIIDRLLNIIEWGDYEEVKTLHRMQCHKCYQPIVRVNYNRKAVCYPCRMAYQSQQAKKAWAKYKAERSLKNEGRRDKKV